MSATREGGFVAEGLCATVTVGVILNHASCGSVKNVHHLDIPPKGLFSLFSVTGLTLEDPFPPMMEEDGKLSPRWPQDAGGT